MSKLPAQAGACSFVVNSAVVLHHCDSVFLIDDTPFTVFGAEAEQATLLQPLSFIQRACIFFIV